MVLEFWWLLLEVLGGPASIPSSFNNSPHPPWEQTLPSPTMGPVIAWGWPWLALGVGHPSHS